MMDKGDRDGSDGVIIDDNILYCILYPSYTMYAEGFRYNYVDYRGYCRGIEVYAVDELYFVLVTIIRTSALYYIDLCYLRDVVVFAKNRE